MIRKSMALALGSLLLCAATDPPPPPAELEPYLVDGRYDPGDYAWIKGRFQDATPEEAEAFQAIMRWSSDCRTAAIAELREQLAAEGVPEAGLENALVGPFLCRVVAVQPMISDNSSFAAFEREVAAVRPVADAFLAATRLAEESARPRAGAELARQLEVRLIGEQVLRRAFTWGLGRDPDSPNLTPLGRAIFQSRMSAAASLRDYRNTEWLKTIVAEHGWPKVSDVGQEASSAAWLLVQHADHDPLFQLRALRLMEPLVAEKEVSPQDYAYLYDRIMLKLNGKQRYGTQVMCQDGVRAPLPLEDEANLDRHRDDMGLPLLSEYIGGMNQRIPCEGLPENSIRRQGAGV